MYEFQFTMTVLGCCPNIHGFNDCQSHKMLPASWQHINIHEYLTLVIPGAAANSSTCHIQQTEGPASRHLKDQS